MMLFLVDARFSSILVVDLPMIPDIELWFHNNHSDPLAESRVFDTDAMQADFLKIHVNTNTDIRAAVSP